MAGTSKAIKPLEFDPLSVDTTLQENASACQVDAPHLGNPDQGQGLPAKTGRHGSGRQGRRREQSECRTHSPGQVQEPDR